ncbi:MAG: hypothetical protein HC772_07735 [Leptolyngbyaceae cyanobacterium CRU_2_3]|nr:hypothetical protein [Leptolyngbyaceae cyanobacterium CRU_2_3]
MLRKLEDLLDELRYSAVQPEQLTVKRSSMLLDLWQTVTTDFLASTIRLRLATRS